MLAFITHHELAILWLSLAFLTGIAFLRYRNRRRKSNEAMGGCLMFSLGATVIGAALVALSFLDMSQRTRPEKMLERFLKVEDVSEFSDLRSEYVGGLDYMAWIYFQTSGQRFNKLIADLDFERIPEGKPNQGLEFAGFSGAPQIPTIEAAVVYYRQSPENHDQQYIVTNSEHNRGWFVSIDY